MTRPRITIRRLMVATALAAAGLSWFAMTPRSDERGTWARWHASSEADWRESARLSMEGVTTIEPEPRGGEFLQFNHYIPRTRPTGPKLAAEFDRTCAENARKCRLMADYHARMRRKWTRASYLPWFGVAPDPPPPLRLEASGIRDMSM